MDQNELLRLQACLDGELSAREREKTAAWLAGQPEAEALFDELQTTRTALAGNEPEVNVPETREFYWSKISRQIELLERAPRWSTPAWWLKYLSPVAGTALLLAVLTFSGSNFFSALDDEESGSPALETSAVVFRSQADEMTVVWLQGDENKDFATPESDPHLPPE